jgi:hypothetical protein
MSVELLRVHQRNKQRCLGEQVSHLLKWPLSCFGKEGPEKCGIGEVAYLTHPLIILNQDLDAQHELLTMKRIYQRQPIPVLSSNATEVVCPIMVLKAKLVIVAMETPLDLVFVSKISAGMIQDRGPQVALNEKLYSHVIAIKPHAAPAL